MHFFRQFKDHNSGKENENYKNNPIFWSNVSVLPACNIHFWWSILVCKILNFCQKLLIWRAHHTFPESRHAQVTKNLYYVLFTRWANTHFLRLQLMDYIGGWRKFPTELVCLFITFLVTKNIAFKSPFNLYFHLIIIEFFWFA